MQPTTTHQNYHGLSGIKVTMVTHHVHIHATTCYMHAMYMLHACTLRYMYTHMHLQFTAQSKLATFLSLVRIHINFAFLCPLTPSTVEPPIIIGLTSLQRTHFCDPNHNSPILSMYYNPLRSGHLSIKDNTCW